MSVATQTESVNVARRLSQWAARTPNVVAIAEPRGRNSDGGRAYLPLSFRELDEDSGRIATGLVGMGVKPGARLAMFVPFSIDFVSLVFALLKAAAVPVLIDPGMGLRNTLDCLDEVRPDGFIAVPLFHALRVMPGGRFAKTKFSVTVGRRWWWGGPTLRMLGQTASPLPASARAPDDPAAIIFTSGSTGPAKGVLYCHGQFDCQVSEIQDFYKIQPGEVDVACFPLFGLFNAAMGVTTVIADMDTRRPARADPRRVVATINDWRATQSFASPAVWDRVGKYCEAEKLRLSSLRRALSAGAPVATPVVARMQNCISQSGEVHTPYGATEALPVASIGAHEILSETGRKTDAGAGVCVGRRFPGIQWRVVKIVDGPIRTLADSVELPTGQIGELIVEGPVVTDRYITRVEANAQAKIADGERFWHRMGDAGYLDAQERFWFCGRVGQRVVTADGSMFSVPCEAIFNRHPAVARSALVGVGPRGSQTPVIVVEPAKGRFPRGAARARFISELRTLALTSPLTAAVQQFLVRRGLPVDRRHNVKIGREELAEWAARQLRV